MLEIAPRLLCMRVDQQSCWTRTRRPRHYSAVRGSSRRILGSARPPKPWVSILPCSWHRSGARAASIRILSSWRIPLVCSYLRQRMRFPAELRPRDDAFQASASTPAPAEHSACTAGAMDGIQGVGTTDCESGPGSHLRTSVDVHRHPARRSRPHIYRRASSACSHCFVWVHLGVSAIPFGSIPPRRNSKKCEQMCERGCRGAISTYSAPPTVMGQAMKRFDRATFFCLHVCVCEHSLSGLFSLLESAREV
jgi:hypothetical protein